MRARKIALLFRMGVLSVAVSTTGCAQIVGADFEGVRRSDGGEDAPVDPGVESPDAGASTPPVCTPKPAPPASDYPMKAHLPASRGACSAAEYEFASSIFGEAGPAL